MKQRLLLLITLQLILVMLISSCTTTAPVMVAGNKPRHIINHDKNFLQDTPKRDKSNFTFKKEPDTVGLFLARIFSF